MKGVRDILLKNINKNMKKILNFIYVFLIIGLESLGNMSAVTTVLQENLIKRNKLVTEEDIIDAVTISRLGPGATTANAVAFLGNKIAGFWGGVIATICYTICPLIVILLIYGFLQNLLEYNFIISALKGGLIYISIIFVESSIQMGKNILTNKTNITIFICALLVSILFKKSCIWIIISAILFGIIKVFYLQKISKKINENIIIKLLKNGTNNEKMKNLDIGTKK